VGALRSCKTTTRFAILLIPLNRNLIFEILALKILAIISNLGGRHSQVGSLAGAVHLLNNNAGVLR
jgi:hypothetical protein